MFNSFECPFNTAERTFRSVERTFRSAERRIYLEEKTSYCGNTQNFIKKLLKSLVEVGSSVWDYRFLSIRCVNRKVAFWFFATPCCIL